MTSLAYIFKMEKSPCQDKFFGRKCFICQPIFKLFGAHVKTFRMQKGDKITFRWMSFRIG